MPPSSKFNGYHALAGLMKSVDGIACTGYAAQCDRQKENYNLRYALRRFSSPRKPGNASAARAGQPQIRHSTTSARGGAAPGKVHCSSSFSAHFKFQQLDRQKAALGLSPSPSRA
jgi:hypothetical protein